MSTHANAHRQVAATQRQIELAQAVQRVAGIELSVDQILVTHGAKHRSTAQGSTDDSGRYLLPAAICRDYRVRPLRIERNILHIAGLDALSKEDSALIQRAAAEATGLRVSGIYLHPADRRDLLMWINNISGTDLVEIESDMRHLASHRDIDGAVLNRVIRRVMEYAIESKVSDVHWERNGQTTTAIGFRIDGALQRSLPTTERVMQTLLARIKALSGMDFSETRRPQDGSLAIQHGGRTIYVRVASTPSPAGESLVMRVQDPNNLQSIASLMADHAPVASRLSAIASGATRQGGGGLVLFTGTMGSGKSASMAGMMMAMPRHEGKILTVEDPVENFVPHVTHTTVNEAVGLTYAAALRGMKRQDANVIVVGEIRDVETAMETIRIAQTGHLAMSTLHTDSASETLPALYGYFAEHGFRTIAATALPTQIKAIVNQVLVPRMCQACARPHTPNEREKNLLLTLGLNTKSSRWMMADGCPRCRHTGTYGRVVAPDAMFFSDTPEARSTLIKWLEARDRPLSDLPGIFHYSRVDAIRSLLELQRITLATAANALSEAGR